MEPTASPRQDGQIGISVVGFGYWGPNLVRNFFETPGCRVVSVCDQSPARLENAKRRYPSVDLAKSLDEVLADSRVDAVVIATPVEAHAPLAKRVLESGRHVLIEKPMTNTTRDAEMLVELASRKGLTLMVDHTFVYTGAVKRIREMVDSKELGRIYYYDSVRVNLGLFQHDVSVIWDLAAHDFSMMDYLLPQRPKALSAFSIAHFPNKPPDMAYLTAIFEDNLIAHFHVNWLSPVKVRQVLVGGERRMVQFDDLQATEKVRIYDRGVKLSEDPTEAKRQTMVAYRLGDVNIPALDQSEALRNECAHFVDCVKNKKTPLSDGMAGLRVVKMLEAAERSTKVGGALQMLD